MKLKATAEVVADDVHVSQHGVGVHNTEFMERGHNSGLSTLRWLRDCGGVEGLRNSWNVVTTLVCQMGQG